MTTLRTRSKGRPGGACAGLPWLLLRWGLGGVLSAVLGITLVGAPATAAPASGGAPATRAVMLYAAGPGADTAGLAVAAPQATKSPDCKPSVSWSKLVHRYRYKKLKKGYGKARLYCGKDKWGYRHIAASDNGKRITNYPGGWAGFNYSITAVEKAWTSEKYNPANETYAYYRLFYLCNSPQGWYKPINFRVVNTLADQTIITAVPAYGRKKHGKCPAPQGRRS
jgi:hypothetical protein